MSSTLQSKVAFRKACLPNPDTVYFDILTPSKPLKTPANPTVFPLSKLFQTFSLTPSAPSPIVNPVKENLLTAVADSVATALPVDVPISFESVDAAIRFLRSRFVDVDWDTFPNRVTIFGDDQRIEGDEDEGLWVLNLVFAPAPARFGDVNAI